MLEAQDRLENAQSTFEQNQPSQGHNDALHALDPEELRIINDFEDMFNEPDWDTALDIDVMNEIDLDFGHDDGMEL